jgi:hypothetical protein
LHLRKKFAILAATRFIRSKLTAPANKLAGFFIFEIIYGYPFPLVSDLRKFCKDDSGPYFLKFFSAMDDLYVRKFIKSVGFEVFVKIWQNNGGEGGIRTPGTLARTTDFESVPFNRSGTSPTFSL